MFNGRGKKNKNCWLWRGVSHCIEWVSISDGVKQTTEVIVAFETKDVANRTY